ncbi:vWA domain-containing protein [Corynebacterium doosanense]|uniref:VWFA domain-containing protein n=1 Tax=Corynebacterium doosanense CAU 212 = DSM 45436 TaxID=558173 RepID=A0A097IFY5_9CORY|nr:VWA domain-containing protein [Corynebacterium doosanense]AIT61017.1 hypothetical protein CDOO_06935 [Corynebacterium doosanense CAU 212 = DSM 45436]
MIATSRRLLITAVLAVTALFAAACSGLPALTRDDEPLSIVAATELEGLAPALEEASDDLGFPITVEYPGGTLTNSRELADGVFDHQVDATWFATNRYVHLRGAGDKLADSHEIASSPVGFGVQSATARELGWDARQPTWAEIRDAATGEDFTFGMTDPTSSNSGFSALVSVATALADTGTALTTQDIERVAPDLRGFFAGQALTSGSSGWLAQAFEERPDSVDAIINYESVLTDLRHDGMDIQVVVPADGVISADYPLSTMAEPAHDGAGEQVAALAQWFAEHPEKLTEASLRPTTGGDLPAELADTSVIELPFPGSMAVTDELLAAYANELRRPGSTAFVLDTSGSMEGERLSSLQNIMHSLIDGTAATPLGEVGLRDNEQVSLIPFASAPRQPTEVTFDREDGAIRDTLNYQVSDFRADGSTAIYEALRVAYDDVDASGGSIPSIVLMTDGELTEGMTFEQFRNFHAGLSPQQQDVPVFVILYGEANAREMAALAELTGGKVFNALDGDLAEAFKEIRAYQ